jgi:large subunit ribosomal protein L21
MKYAVILHNGKQYKVAENDSLALDYMKDALPSHDLIFDQVLLVVDGDKKLVGAPMVEGAKVKASIVDHAKGEKLRVAKFKSKVRYRKVIGFRAKITNVKINSIDLK